MAGSSEQANLLAELVTEAVRRRLGSVGVLVRDIPAPSPQRLVEMLLKLRTESGNPLRIAYLQPGGNEAAQVLGIGGELWTTDIEQAETWRNTRELAGMIVVVAEGNEAKLSSLEEFESITARDLKTALVDRALGSAAGVNDVQVRWWKLLGEDAAIGLAQLLDYYLSIATKSGTDLVHASSRQIYRLGMLPDPQLLDDGSVRAIQTRVAANRDLVTRLQTLTAKDRRTITRVIASVDDPDEKQRLREALDQLYRSRWQGAGMSAISFQHAESLVRARTKKSAPPAPPRPHDENASDVAAASLIEPSREPDVAAVVDSLRQQLGEIDTDRLRPEKLKLSMPDAPTDAESTVRLDVLNLVNKVLDDGIYGALLTTEPIALEDLLRRLEPERHIVTRWARNDIVELMSAIRDDPVGEKLATAFEAYDAARHEVLPLVQSLTAEPLAVAANRPTREKLLVFIHSYEHLNRTACDHYDELFNRFGADVNQVIGLLLLLETVVIKAGDQIYAIAAPTHPLHLWHYATYCEIVIQQRERLDDKDRGLVVDSAKRLPNFFTSLFVPSVAIGTGDALPYLGRIGHLPYFGKTLEPNAAPDGVATVRTLIESYVAFEPHAMAGFRLALVDPPASGAFLAMVEQLAEERVIEGAHVVIYRHSAHRLSLELGLDESDEDRVAQLFGSLTKERLYSFEVRELNDREVGAPEGEVAHLEVIFDRSTGQSSRARPAAHPIQPLAVPRRIHYSQVHRTVELEPAPGGPFDAYDKVVSRVAQGGGANYLSVHQDAELRRALNAVADRVASIALVDRQVDRDLELGAIRVYTNREGERDVAAFARSAATFRRPLREVVRNYNAFVSDAELDDLLTQLSALLDSGVMNVRPDRNGKTNHNRVKGLLGTLIAARWFRQAPNRLLVSLDGEDARRWLHLSPDPHRADLLGFEWTGATCTVSVIEVKAVQSPTTEYQIDGNGVATGPAIQQILATRELLNAVFVAQDQRADELITTPARREIVREHLYRELTKSIYPAEHRKSWAERLQRLLDGNVTASIRCQLVDVRLGVDSSTLAERAVAATVGADSVAVQITQLNEQGIPALTSRLSIPGESDRSDSSARTGADEGAASGETVGTVEGSHPEQPPSPLPPSNLSEETEVNERPRALLGTAPGNYGHEHEIWFDPALPGDELPNPHIAITGETGSGKTQATKAIVGDLRDYGLPTLVLDFKDDYADAEYALAEGFSVYDPSFESLPFNPLEPPIDVRTGRANPTHHLYQVAEIIKRIYRLGDQQAYRVREALKQAYQSRGVATTSFQPSPEQTYPSFEEVRPELELEKGNEALLGRMSPIFDLGLFDATASTGAFGGVADRATVVRLGQLPGDETKNSVAEFFLMALYNHLIRQPQRHTLTRLLVLDEAWRLVESPFLEPLMREGRAFGLGVVIATQFPRDLPEAVVGSTATKLFFSQTQLEQIREVQRTVVGKTSGPDADHVAGVMRGLAPLTCVLHSKQHAPFVRVRIKPYFERG